jgi:hypothetical protein
MIGRFSTEHSRSRLLIFVFETQVASSRDLLLHFEIQVDLQRDLQKEYFCRHSLFEAKWLTACSHCIVVRHEEKTHSYSVTNAFIEKLVVRHALDDNRSGQNGP